MEWIPGVDLVRVAENRPRVEFLPKSPNEESEVCGQRPHPSGLQGKIDTEVCVSGGNEAGVSETDGVEDRESVAVHINIVIQWEFHRIVLYNDIFCQYDATIKRVPNTP